MLIVTVVLYIRDHGDLDFFALQNHLKNSLSFPSKRFGGIGISITKPKNAFIVIPNPSNKFLWNFKNFLFN